MKSPSRQGATRRFVGRLILSAALIAGAACLAPQSSEIRADTEEPPGRASAETVVSEDANPWHQVEQAILRATNRERTQRGFSELVWEPRLADIGRQTSRTLLRQRRLDHIDGQGRGPSQRVALDHRRLIGLVGENLASFSGHWSPLPDELVKEVVRGWMESPGHRKNMLREDYTHLGVGLASLDRELRATQVFAQAKAYLKFDLPRRLRTGRALPLSFDSAFEVPEGVSLAPEATARSRERFASPDFVAPQEWQVDAAPGIYRLRFFFRQTAQRFGVVDGPQIEVIAAPE